MKLIKVLQVASAAFFFAGSALAQTSGTVSNHAIAVGKGMGQTGFTSVTCADRLFLSGVSGLDPACRALVGADLPFPGVLTLGGVKSLAAASNQFLTGLGTDGALTRAQPAFSNLSGSWTCAQAAALTGNVTTSAGSCATTIAALAVTNSMLAGSIAASKLVGTDIATVGTITTGTWSGTAIAVANGGTGAATAANARTNLGVAIGSNVQAWDADLDAFALKTAPAGAVVGTTDTQTLTNKTISGSSNTLTVLAGSQLTGQVPVANGGTGASTAAAARLGLNVESVTTLTNANLTATITDRVIATTATNFTAARTVTLPALSTYNPGQLVVVVDSGGAINGANTLTITANGSDTINGSTSLVVGTQYGGAVLWPIGSNKWGYIASSGGGGGSGTVTQVTCGTGLTGGTFTTSGTCAVSLPVFTNSLGADVNLNNTANYFDGPSVAQGTSGTWWASGTVAVNDSGVPPAGIFCKLWDGTTVAASTGFSTGGNGATTAAALSGYLVNPAGNIRISCRDASTTNGKIIFNVTGNSKDSTISVHRVQ